MVPVGSVAYRLSLFSAACAAAACGALYWFVRRWGLQPVAAATAALLVAFSPSFWSQANIQRVYSLNALFVVLATAAAFRWHRSRNPRLLVVAFFLCGLGASNHTFMAIYAVMLLAFVLIDEPALWIFWRRPRSLLLATGAFIAGLLPYLFLPLRSMANPRLDWGNPETVENLVKVVSRQEFWQRAWIEGPADLLPITADYILSLGAELFWIGTACAVVGVVVGWRRGWPVLLPLLVMAGNLAAVAMHGSRTDIFIWHRYYIPSYTMLALLAAIGLDAILVHLPSRLRLLPLALPLLMLVVGWSDFDRSRYRVAEDFSLTLLESIPPGAHLSASDDNILFVLMYLHLVEGLRPDINLILQGVGDAELPPLRFDPDREPLFLTHHPNWNVPEMQIVPVGLVFRVVRSGTQPPVPEISKTRLEGEDDPRVPKDYLTRNLIGHFHFMLGWTYEARDWPRAWREYQAAAAAAPQNDVLFYNLGLIYRRNGLFEEALAAFERSHEINDRSLASGSGAAAADRIEELTPEVERLDAIEAALAERIPASSSPWLAAYHRAMADLLAARGEKVAARGHRLRALVAGNAP
jgi:tetratricopeptide (TPR) repeat protein